MTGIPEDLPREVLLPEEEYSKFYKVLRMRSGQEVALLPGDGRIVRCRLEGRSAVPVETERPDTEPAVVLTLCLAMPKADKLDESVRMGSELGVSSFVVFPSERTVVRWDEKKREARLRRLRAIAREAAEVSFRTRLPQISLRGSLEEVLEEFADAQVLSEQERVGRSLAVRDVVRLVVGPEGGWAPKEVAVIGDRAVTLGPRVLRVDTAVAAACALVLAQR